MSANSCEYLVGRPIFFLVEVAIFEPLQAFNLKTILPTYKEGKPQMKPLKNLLTIQELPHVLAGRF